MIDEEEYKKRLERARQLRNSIGIVSSSDNSTEINSSSSNANNYQSRLERAKNLRNSLGIYTSEELKDTTTNVIKNDNESNKTTTNNPTAITIEAENEANKPTISSKEENKTNVNVGNKTEKNKITVNPSNKSLRNVNSTFNLLPKTRIATNKETQNQQIITRHDIKVREEAEEINKQIEKGGIEKFNATTKTILKNIEGGVLNTVAGLANVVTTVAGFGVRGLETWANVFNQAETAETLNNWYDNIVETGRDISDTGSFEIDVTNRIENDAIRTAGIVTNTVSEVATNAVIGLILPGGGKAGTIAQGLSVGGRSSQEVLDENPDKIGQATITGIAKGYISYLTEKLFDANILTKGQGSLISISEKIDDLIFDTIKSKYGKEFANKTVGIIGENIEEILEDNIGNIIDKLVNDKEFPTIQEWWNNTTETAKVTTLSTIIMSLLGLGGSNFESKENDIMTRKVQQIINEGGYSIQYDTNNISNTTDMQTFYTTQFDQEGDIENINTTQGKEILNPNKKVNVTPVIIKNADTNAYNIIDANTGVMLDSTPYSTLIQAEAEFDSKMINLDEASIKGINEKIIQSNIAINNKIKEVITQTKTQLANIPQNVQNDHTTISNNKTTNYPDGDKKTDISKNNLNMEDRTNENVSDKNIKSYQEEHPEIKEEIQSMADMFLEDVANSTEGKRYKAGDTWTGQKRSTTKLLAQIKDETGATWNNITKALNDISKGNANYSLAKKIEIILDKALTEGYTNIYGKQIMPNDSYIAKRTEIEGKEPSTHKVSDFEFDENDRIFGEKIRGGNNNVRNENTRQKINRTEKRENSRREKESKRNDGTNQEKLSKGLQRFEEEQQVNLGKDFKVYKEERSKLTDTEKIIQEEFSKITGLDYEIFSTNKNTSKNAFYYDNNLFVKHNSLVSKKTANFLPFHEFGHWLRKNNNKEWSKVKNIIENTITIEQINKYKDIISDKSIFEGMNENQIREFVIEEIESDYIGNWANDIVNWRPYIESKLLSEQYVKLLIDITNENIDTHYNIFGSIEQQEQVYTEISSVIKNIIENKKIKDIVKYNSDGREIKDNNYIDFLVERYKDNKNISKVKTTTKTIQQILKNSDSRNETLKQLYKEIKNPTNIKLETQLKNLNGEFEKVSLDIDITLTGLKESFNKGESIEKYSIIPYLDNLILTTQDGNGYFVMHDDKNRTEVRGYYYLFNTAMIDNKLYATKIDIKKTKAGDRFYVHRVKLINNEGASIQANNSLELEVPVGQEAPSIDNSIAQKNNSVKTVTTNNIQKEIKYSDREDVTDSQGRRLSKEQQEFFKDSKVRDKDGNLLEVYHSTGSYGFTKFSEKYFGTQQGSSLGNGFYFTSSQSTAKYYKDIAEENGSKKAGTYKVYLNIKNPLYSNKYNSKEMKNRVDEIIKIFNPKIDTNDSYYEQAYKPYVESKLETFTGFIDYIKGYANKQNKSSIELLQQLGYDGIIDGNEYVVFNSNQIKNIDNTNPTNNSDIRYSDREDIDENRILYYTYPTGDKFEIIKNPTNSEYIRLTEEARKILGEHYIPGEPLIRRTYDSQGNVYIWKALDSTHYYVEKFLGRNNNLKFHQNQDFVYSKLDSKGRILTKEQQEFFKDSKVRDENGNLLEVYHGTVSDFTVFDIDKKAKNGRMLGDGFYFTSSKEVAKNYSREKGKIYKSYLNIKNPLEIKNVSSGELTYAIRNINPYIEADIYKRDGTIDEKKIRQYLLDNGYDGIHVPVLNTIQGLSLHNQDIYVAFNSNQIKNVDNLNPTSNEDIRYSDRKDVANTEVTDNQGRILTKEQQEYFKDSKVRDENGNLLTVYHGSDANFTVFEKEGGKRNIGGLVEYEADSKGFFLATSKDFASEYGNNVKELYANVTNPLFSPNKTYTDSEMENIRYIIQPLVDADVKNGDLEIANYTDGSIRYRDNSFYRVPENVWQRYASTETGIDWEYIDSDAFNEVVNRMKEKGYDGTFVDELQQDEDGNSISSIFVFNSNQIKNIDNTNPTSSEDIRYSNRIDTDKEGQGGFYSQLENVIEQKMPNISNSQQILNLLKNNGIKQDELDWTGIEDYINSKKLQKITKQEVLDYIKANQLQIKEVTKGYSKLKQLKAPIEEDIRNKKDEISKILNKYDIAHEEYDLTPINPNGTFAGTIGDYMADSLKKLVNLEKFAQEERIEVKRNKAGKIVHTPVIIYGLIKEDGVLYNPFTLKDLDNDMQDLEYLYDGLHEAEMQLSFIEDEYGDYVDELGLPKYKDYALKYGENYKEILFTVPQQEDKQLKEYNSPHWDESNIIAHARTQDFEDITGNKVLFIEEIQSDMHQEGRKKEYFSFKEGENQKEKLKEDFVKLLAQENELRSRLHDNLTNKETEEIKKQISDIQRLQEENLKENKQIGYKLNSTNNSWIDSQFPFKKNWHEFVLRRMINNAVLQGYNKVAWTTGEQQNRRYDLSKYVDKIKWTKKDDESMYWIRAYKWEKQYEEYNLVIDKEVKSEELESFLGKEIHNKIISSKERDGELVGSDLEVGGDGMKGFYDKIIPEYLNKYLKKWNSKVEIVYMGKDLKNTSEYKEHGLQGLIDIINNKNIPYITKQMGFTITEEMRESVKKQGQPLYSNRDLDKEQKSTPYDERVYKENIDYIKYLQDNNYLKNLMKVDNSLGQTNAQGSNRLIEQEIQNVDATGAWDNSIPVTKLTDIKNTIEEYLGKEIRRGHFRQRAYGIYKPDIDAIRVKEYKDIDNILHELGHALDVGKRMDIDKKAISEELLLAVKRHGGYENENKNVKLQEGFAEVIRMYGINPSKATTEYPKTIAILNEFRQKNSSFNDFMNKVQSQIYNYIYQNPRNRILSNQSIGEQTDKTPITKNKVKENIIKWVWDKNYLLKSAVNELSKANGKEAKLSQNAYILARLAGGVNNKAISMISDGYIDLNGNRLMPGLNQLGELLNNDPQRFNDLRVFLVAQRDLEYKSKSLKTGLRTMDSKAVVEQFKNDYQIQQASQIVYDTLDGVLQYAVNNGLISKENAEALRESNAFYVPFQRVLDLDRGNQVGRSGSVAEIIRKRTGSELDIKDVLENIVVNSANIIQQVENNNVLSTLYNQGAEAGIKNNLFQKIPTPMQKVGTETLSVWESELKKQGIDTDNIDLEKTIDIFAPNNKIDTENLVTSFIDTNGKRVYLQFAKGTQDLFNSIMGLDKNTNSMFLKIMRKMNMPLRYGATMANVGFAIPNMISDTAQATIYSEAGFIPVVDNALGILDILTATNKTVRNFIKQYYPGYVERINRLYSLYEQSGASNSTRLSQYRKTTQEIMKDIYGTKNSETLGIKESLKPLKRLLDIMTYIPELSESSTRFRVFEKNYEAYKNKGGSELDARIKGAIESRDATQDFGRTGTLMHEINQLIPFSSARVGSSLTFAEKVKANPKITSARIAILTTIAMIIKGMVYDDDEIEELNQRKKNDNFVFKIGDSIITIKKPQGIMRSIINFAEYIQDLATGHIEEGKEGKKLAEWIENSIMDNMPADEIGGLIPNAISPLIENAVNKDFYYNTDIVKSYDLDLPEYMQYYDYTSQLAIWLGKIFNYSPAKIDNLISGYFGGLGTQVTDTIDYISGKLGLSAEKPAMGAEDDAIGKRFVVNINENSASIDEVYTRETELTKKKNGGTITSKEEEELERLTEAISIMATINKQIKAIKADLTTSGEEKAELIRPLQKQKTDTARQALGKELLYSENDDKITSTKFYPSRSTLSQSGYTLNLTEDMKKEYEQIAYTKYTQYEKQGLYSEKKLEQLESQCKDYAKQYLMKKYRSKLTKTK